jgi:hypothetical protein
MAFSAERAWDGRSGRGDHRKRKLYAILTSESALCKLRNKNEKKKLGDLSVGQ